MKATRLITVLVVFFVLFLLTVDITFAAEMLSDEDSILGEGGFVEKIGGLQRFSGIALLVGVAASVFILYKKSK